MVAYRQSHQMARLQLSINTPCRVCVTLLIPIDIWHPLPTQSRVCSYFCEAHTVTSIKKIFQSSIKKIFQSYHFIILRGVHKLSYDLCATSKFLAPKRWNGTLFIPRPTHFRHHGTKFSLVGCPGARYLRTPTPDNTHRAELLGADTLRRTVVTLPKKNLTICLKTPTCTNYIPPPPKKKFNSLVGFGVFKKATTKAVSWDAPTFWRNLPPTSSGYSGWGTLYMYQNTRHHIPEPSCHIRFIMGCPLQDRYNHYTAACHVNLMLAH